MEAVVAAAKEQAFREQRHRHTASLSALREERAALERAKRELESCLIAARNQAALLQACQREESGEGAQCWEQAATEVEGRIAAAQAAAMAEYEEREAAAKQEQATQAAEVRRAAQELAALRRAATLELQQLQATTGVTIGSCGTRGQAQRRRRRGRGKGAPAGRACCTIM
ncbi:1 protease [Chlorella sorokiniana]|uniref:1 protease n=1 Tax=Chlorella sorokiniana TaxID=3076 RepID=A0A2P6TDZ6_CHLSO|nr:1 protease [Chlorella sorokiniana]|eukprot:PRW20861.1 1 protease [Chlorella sorokiniana]